MTRFTRAAIVAGLVAAAAGCGQQGPLVLPESARPIERVDAPVAPAPAPTDDERQDEQ